MLTKEHMTSGQAGISPVERLHALVAADMKATDMLIHKGMASSVQLIPDLARHLIDSGGKRLRPLLTLAAAKAGGYHGDGHVSLAAAVEFIHTATLLHDDVVDESALRRGKVSANLVWGNKPSVLVGDFFSRRAFQLMVETGNLAVLDILSSASAVIAEGEVMQLSSANNLSVSEEHYHESGVGQDRGPVRRRRRRRSGADGRGQRLCGRRCAPMATIWASPSSWWTTRWTIPAARP